MPIEIERKFLIRLPDLEAVAALPGCRVRRIVQTYLRNIPGSQTERRVRRIGEDDRVEYVFTEKDKLEGITRMEAEQSLSREEYRAYLEEAVSQLEKTRYAFPWRGHMMEIDVYPYEIGGEGLVGRAVLEVELEDAEEAFEVPPFLEIERELTGTGEFSNKKMARRL